MTVKNEEFIQELIVRDQLFKGISKATQLLISTQEFPTSVQAALQTLAETVAVNRVYIFKNITENGVVYLHQSYEYVRKAKPQLANESLQKLAYQEGYSRWYEVLSKKGVISGNIEDFPASEKALLEVQDIISIIVVPIFIQSDFWGFIGFDDCEKKRIWRDAEKSILITMAASFGSAFARQTTAENLHKSEILFRTLTEYLKSGVYTISQTGKFLYANPEVLKISGYSKEEFLQLNFFDIVHPHFEKLVKERAFLRLQGQDIPSSYEFIIATKKGENRWVEVSNCRIMLNDNPVILGTANDVTERKQAEADLAKEKEQLAVTLRSIGDGVITTDKVGNVLLLNKTAEKLTGWKQEEAFQKPLNEVFEIIDETTTLPIKNPAQEVIEKEQIISLSNHTMLIPKNGEPVSIADSAAPIFREDGKIEGVVLVFRDVTEEKKAAKVKETLLKIAISVTTSKNVTELYSRIHQELQILIPAHNFYIATLNEEFNLIQVPYFVDDKMSFSNVSSKNSLVAEVIKKRKALLLNEEDIQEKIADNEITWVGDVAKSWLGVPLIMSNRTIGAVVVQDYQKEHVFSEEDKKILQFISEHIALAIEKMQVEKHLVESEEKYRLLFEAGNDSILLLENDVCIDCNKKAVTMFKAEKGKLVGKKFQEFCFANNDKKNCTQNIAEKIDLAYEQEAQFFECEMQTCDGKTFISEIGLNPLNWKNRIYLLVIIRDITERKKKEEDISASLQEKEILLQEIHHRVKNNMQVISSMLNLQSSLVEKPKYRQMFRDSQNRVKTMALVHEKLYRTEDFSNIDFQVYVKDLISNLFKGYNTSNIRFVSEIDKLSLDISTAIPCGLIINELVTNSLKYAFPENRKGEVRLSLTNLQEQQYEMIFSDNGIGLPETVDMEGTKTLGLYLVKILTIQLNGNIEIKRDKGTTFRICFESEDKRKR